MSRISTIPPKTNGLAPNLLLRTILRQTVGGIWLFQLVFLEVNDGRHQPGHYDIERTIVRDWEFVNDKDI